MPIQKYHSNLHNRIFRWKKTVAPAKGAAVFFVSTNFSTHLQKKSYFVIKNLSTYRRLYAGRAPPSEILNSNHFRILEEKQ